jgi:hypothetical protein
MPTGSMPWWRKKSLSSVARTASTSTVGTRSRVTLMRSSSALKLASALSGPHSSVTSEAHTKLVWRSTSSGGRSMLSRTKAKPAQPATDSRPARNSGRRQRHRMLRRLAAACRRHGRPALRGRGASRTRCPWRPRWPEGAAERAALPFAPAGDREAERREDEELSREVMGSSPVAAHRDRWPLVHGSVEHTGGSGQAHRGGSTPGGSPARRQHPGRGGERHREGHADPAAPLLQALDPGPAPGQGRQGEHHRGGPGALRHRRGHREVGRAGPRPRDARQQGDDGHGRQQGQRHGGPGGRAPRQQGVHHGGGTRQRRHQRPPPSGDQAHRGGTGQEPAGAGEPTGLRDRERRRRHQVPAQQGGERPEPEHHHRVDHPAQAPAPAQACGGQHGGHRGGGEGRGHRTAPSGEDGTPARSARASTTAPAPSTTARVPAARSARSLRRSTTIPRAAAAPTAVATARSSTAPWASGPQTSAAASAPTPGRRRGRRPSVRTTPATGDAGTQRRRQQRRDPAGPRHHHGGCRQPRHRRVARRFEQAGRAQHALTPGDHGQVRAAPPGRDRHRGERHRQAGQHAARGHAQHHRGHQGIAGGGQGQHGAGHRGHRPDRGQRHARHPRGGRTLPGPGRGRGRRAVSGARRRDRGAPGAGRAGLNPAGRSAPGGSTSTPGTPRPRSRRGAGCAAPAWPARPRR